MLERLTYLLNLLVGWMRPPIDRGIWYTILWLKLFFLKDGALFNAYTTRNPFWGTELLDFSIERGSGALKGLTPQTNNGDTRASGPGPLGRKASKMTPSRSLAPESDSPYLKLQYLMESQNILAIYSYLRFVNNHPNNLCVSIKILSEFSVC